MGIVDKAKNAAENAIGEVKEKVGELTGKDDLRAEGKTDQAKSSVKGVVEDAKDKLGG